MNLIKNLAIGSLATDISKVYGS